uniref:Ribonuclease H protein At1g65750 family n=1 Tax=Cajanus cajan TaxID=3821 RepID=A0A151S3B1_CAJCA|nr:Putative ribonuclease H protein At1g65750 family [Cajanus cajan]
MRNERVFNGCDSSVWEALRRVHALHTTMVRAFAVVDEHTPHDAGLTLVSCIFAEGLQTSLHVDASFNTTSGQACIGGLVRDSNGRWLWGFFGAVEAVDALQVELLAILHGLRIVWSRRIQFVLCVTHDIQSTHRLTAILYSIKDLMHKPWTIQFEHSFREGNKCAYLLARRGQM